MPERVQLSRRKGWRKPENTVVVSRPSKWGNPYSIEDHGRDHALSLYRNDLENSWAGWAIYNRIREELAGKNLACWCPLDLACHADILLELANRDGTEAGS